MKHHAITLLFLLLALACDVADDGPGFRVGCDGSASTTGDPPPTPPPPSSVGLPSPTAPCPSIVDGPVTFCPDALAGCREVVVRNSAGASGSGPLALHWHGTGESPEAVLAWDSATLAILGMVEAESGLLVVPRADAAAVARTGNPFPWWVVCNETTGTNCGRPDDFILADEIVACALEQQLVSAERITTSGMSAGGIMASHLVDRLPYLAGAVSWSGGMPASFQPTTPASSAAVLAIHGGASDVYCGAGVPGGCYAFQEPSEALALDVANAGRFAFVCDHQAGHSTAMGGEGAAFLAASSALGHAWAAYPFGYPGTGPSWMLNHYCYAAGMPSPWGSP